MRGVVSARLLFCCCCRLAWRLGARLAAPGTGPAAAARLADRRRRLIARLGRLLPAMAADAGRYAEALAWLQRLAAQTRELERQVSGRVQALRSLARAPEPPAPAARFLDTRT